MHRLLCPLWTCWSKCKVCILKNGPKSIHYFYRQLLTYCQIDICLFNHGIWVSPWLMAAVKLVKYFHLFYVDHHCFLYWQCTHETNLKCQRLIFTQRYVTSINTQMYLRCKQRLSQYFFKNFIKTSASLF